MRKFNTEGPIQADIHYCIPPISRIDSGHLMELIDDERYFVLHAPRQTGKTSCLLAFVDELNRGGRYRAVYVNVEAAQAYRHDVNQAVRTVLSHLAISARRTLGDDYPDRARGKALADDGGGGAFRSVLSGWAKSSPKPIVLVIDEIDAMVGDSLISVLRQLRVGYPNRPGAFPQSVVLCGVRDVRDDRIIRESLRLGDFTRDDVEKLYAQHTEETGQRFEPGVIDLVWDLTQGQPWLVNALARRACFGIAEGLDRSRPITADLIHQAREAMVVERVTHLDQLADKLKEPRVRSVVEPIVEGTQRTVAEASDDTQYVVDLGLVRRGPQGLEIANRIYAEVIPRELSYEVQTDLLAEETPPYLGPGNKFRMDWLLEGFQQFFRENSEAWVERFTYKESGPHLLLQAYLQRLMNGGGRIEREYGLGRGRTDLLVVWKWDEGVQRVVIEIKLRRGSLEATVAKGLEQTRAYMDRCGASEGHLVVFDRSPDLTWKEKVYRREQDGIVVWGM